MKITVVVTTCNRFEALAKVLTALNEQIRPMSAGSPLNAGGFFMNYANCREIIHHGACAAEEDRD